MLAFIRIPKNLQACFIAAVFLVLPIAAPAQAPDSFRWIDFHAPNDQDVIVWVTRALDGQKWTAIREIGVQYDAALVITTLRTTAQAAPNHDSFAIWSVSLSNRSLTQVLKGTNLNLMDWMLFSAGNPRELAATYDDCSDCDATTFMTAFYYDLRQHTWSARWVRSGQGIPLWTTTSVASNVSRTQLYAAMADPNGVETIGTWHHLDYGKQKPAEDFVYRYDMDPTGMIERTQLLFGRDALAMKERLCRGSDFVPGLSRGQESALCAPFQKGRVERKPVTTPPPNNAGQSRPPGY